jgi:EAL domain-containing protein (putative c-di-GMP-specific phosphodiesterase class I)
MVSAIGCRKIQGFIFGRPMPFEEIAPYPARFAMRRTA